MKNTRTSALWKLGFVGVLLVNTIGLAAGQSSVPGTVPAIDYNDIDNASHSESCTLPQDSNCAFGCVLAQEWLEYWITTTWQYEGLFKITIRASSDDPKSIRLFFDDKLVGEDLEFPGGDTEAFVDRSVSGVFVPSGAGGRLRVELADGEMHLCSISFSVDCSSEPDCLACLDREGHCSWSLEDDECVPQSDCSDYDECEWRNHKKDRCPVDCSGEALSTCEECVEKDGCGWAPELGECRGCQYASDFEYICWEDKRWGRWVAVTAPVLNTGSQAARSGASASEDLKRKTTTFASSRLTTTTATTLEVAARTQIRLEKATTEMNTTCTCTKASPGARNTVPRTRTAKALNIDIGRTTICNANCGA